MTKVIFYEKPGCIGNTRQKKLLIRSGHDLDVRDMTSVAWTPEMLRPFFGDRPIPDWFNMSAPSIKSGKICPGDLDEDEALVAMCVEPLLIRRPLIQVGGRCEAGFETDLINEWIGLSDDTAAQVGEGCPRDMDENAGGGEQVCASAKTSDR